MKRKLNFCIYSQHKALIRMHSKLYICKVNIFVNCKRFLVHVTLYWLEALAIFMCRRPISFDLYCGHPKSRPYMFPCPVIVFLCVIPPLSLPYIDTGPIGLTVKPIIFLYWNRLTRPRPKSSCHCLARPGPTQSSGGKGRQVWRAACSLCLNKWELGVRGFEEREVWSQAGKLIDAQADHLKGE